MKKILLLSFAALLIAGGCTSCIDAPPYAASTKTWTFGDQTWSDAIRIPECNKAIFTESEDAPDCRSYTDGSETWYYYNWAYVDAKQQTLCPAPWRVPSWSDFKALMENAGSATLNREWGHGGIVREAIDVDNGYFCALWSITSVTPSEAMYLGYSVDGQAGVSRGRQLSYGMQVRCVR